MIIANGSNIVFIQKYFFIILPFIFQFLLLQFVEVILGKMCVPFLHSAEPCGHNCGLRTATGR